MIQSAVPHSLLSAKGADFLHVDCSVPAALRTAGLIYATRRGQHREYEITPGRVTCQRDKTTGKHKLEVFAAGGSGVSVTITVPAVLIPAPRR